MKLSKCFQGVLLGSAFLLVTDAFAANKGTLHVSSPEIVAGKRLTAGDYTVRWEGAESRIQLRIMQGAKVVAAIPARMVALDGVSLSDSVVVEIDGNGNRRLSRICFKDQKVALEIEEVPSTAIVQGNN